MGLLGQGGGGGNKVKGHEEAQTDGEAGGKEREESWCPEKQQNRGK